MTRCFDHFYTPPRVTTQQWNRLGPSLTPSSVYGETNMLRYAPAATQHTCCLIALFAMILFAPSILAQTQPIPQQPAQSKQIQTLAIVNGEQITRQQVANECMRRFGRETLEDIVNKFLVAQECQRTGIVITEKDVNDEIVKTAAKFGLSAEKYMHTICSRREITPDRFKNDVIWNQLALERLAESRIQVTPDEINQRMEYEFGERVQVRQIVFDSLQLANQVQQAAAANPDDFVRLAKQHSIDRNSASSGGLMWPIRRNSELPELEQLAFALQPGQVSRVIPVAETFVVLRCERKIPAEQVPQEQLPAVRERIIDMLTQDKLRMAAAQLFDRLQTETEIVNVMNDPVKSKQMPGVAALVNNRQILIRKVAEECITRFGTQMLDTEVNRTIMLQSMKQLGVQVNQQDIDTEIRRAATVVGYTKADGSVDMDRWLAFVTGGDQSKVDFYVEDEIWPTVALKKLVATDVAVTDEDLNKGFEANFGPRVDALAILLNDNRSAQKVWNMASAEPTADYFGRLAKQYSIDPATRNNFGEIPAIPRHGGQPALEAEAFRLRAGEISQVVQVGENFVILFCKGRTEPVVTDFDAVRRELHDDILEKKYRIAMANKFQSLRENAQIDNFLAGTSQPGAAAIREARDREAALPRTRR
ncbi:MAG: peptidylprolyl isomerase [Planctomycetota bacterium]